MVLPPGWETPAACGPIIVEKPGSAVGSAFPGFPLGVPRVHSRRCGRGVIGKAGVIGPYAVVGTGARIGDGAVIGPHCVVGAGVSVGEGTQLFPSVTLYSGTTLGARVTIHAGARIGSDGFGYVQQDGRHLKIPHVGRCVIEDDVEIGANTTIDRGSIDDTVVGAGTKIDNLVQIAHNVRIGRVCLIMAQVGIAGSVRVEDGAMLLGQVGVSGLHDRRRGGRLCRRAVWRYSA